MSEVPGDLRSGRQSQLAHPRQRQPIAVIVDTELRGRAATRRHHMRLDNPFAALQQTDQDIHAAITRIGNLREQQREIQLQLRKLIAHGIYLDSVQLGLSNSAPDPVTSAYTSLRNVQRL